LFIPKFDIIDAMVKRISFFLVLFVSVGLLYPFMGGAQTDERLSPANATLSLSPDASSFFVGTTFDVSIILDTGGETINAVETELRFPPNLLQVTSPTAARSFIAIWTSPPSYSNEEGYVRFQGGVPAPGVKTSGGILSTVTFRATKPGNVVLELKDSRVLLADGSGTNILDFTLGARYSIVVPPPQGPRVYSPTHQKLTTWYRNSDATFAWDRDKGVGGFSWSLDEIPGGIPDTVTEGDNTAVTFEDLEDGLWYFHIRAKKERVWGGVTVFPVKIDTTPPAMFIVKLDPKERVTVGSRTLARFRTTDESSGVERYELKVLNISRTGETQGSTFFIESESPYTLPDLSSGSYNIIVRAYDLAGNFQESSATLEVIKPIFGLFVTRGLNLGFVVIPWPWVLLPSFVFTFLLGFFAFRFWRKLGYLSGHFERRARDLQKRLRSGLAPVQKKIEEDVSLKKRFSKEIKRMKTQARVPARPSKKETKTIKMIIALFLFGLLLFYGNNVTAKVEAPRILTHQLELASNQLFYLSGIAPLESIVTLTISGENQETIKADVLADENGAWEYLHDLYLQPGFYRVWVEAKSSDDAIVGPSEVRTFRVTSRLATEERDLLAPEFVLGMVLVFFVFLNGILSVCIIYSWRHSGILRNRLRKETKEVHEALKLGFQIIKRELTHDLTVLEKDLIRTREKGILKKEREIKRSLLKDIKKIERSIQKEVSDIDRIL